jgi:hypothetical protein
MWQSDGRPSHGNTGKVSVDTNQAFSYLDMEMYWSSRGQLLFRVHLQPNQQLLYILPYFVMLQGYRVRCLVSAGKT